MEGPGDLELGWHGDEAVALESEYRLTWTGGGHAELLPVGEGCHAAGGK